MLWGPSGTPVPTVANVLSNMRTVGDAGPYDMDYRKTPPVAEATGGALLGFICLQKLFYLQGIVLLSIRKAFSADCGFFSPIRLFQGLSASLSASVM